MNEETNISKIFDKYASNYDDFTIEYTVSRRYEFVKSLLGQKVFEVGASTGELLKYINTEDFEYILLSDASEEMCNVIKNTFNHNAKCVDIDNITLKNVKFNSILALDVLCYAKNISFSLKSLGSLLEDGGSIIVSTFNPKLKFLIYIRYLLNKFTNFKHVWFNENIPREMEYINIDLFKKGLEVNNLEIFKTHYIAPIPFQFFDSANRKLEKTFFKHLSTNILYEIKKNDF